MYLLTQETWSAKKSLMSADPMPMQSSLAQSQSHAALSDALGMAEDQAQELCRRLINV